MSDVGAYEELFVHPDPVFEGANGLKRSLGGVDEHQLAAPWTGHAGAGEVLPALVTLISDLRAAVTEQGATLANAVRLATIETMIADSGSRRSSETWYGL